MRVSRSVAFFLLFVMIFIMVPPSLWHHHEASKTLETFHCEHDSHLNHEEEECLVCDWQTTSTYLPVAVNNATFVPSQSGFVAIPAAPLILKHGHLPFQRGPPQMIS